MNRYQIVMPNGDIIGVTADRMDNNDGDLKFYVKNAVVGEARYWQAWTLIGTVPGQAETPPEHKTQQQKFDAGIAYVNETIERMNDVPAAVRHERGL